VRVVFVQYGDYAEAERRLAAGGKETYYAQRFTVGFVATLVNRFEEVTVVTIGGDRPDERLPSGVRTLGVELYPEGRRPRSLQLILALERLRPDQLILMTPVPTVLAWALARRVRVLPMFFDSFHAAGWKARARYALLARLLSFKKIEWVANHNLAASLDLVRIGLDPAKVVPFDWPVLFTPAQLPAKLPPTGDSFRLMYVGLLTEPKGVGDLIDAVGELRARGGARYSLTIVGRENPEIAKRAADLQLGDLVQLRGLIPHDDIIPMMRDHDVVVVPSRHEYPEGLPATIYEGLCSRSPVLVSDHPMFRLKIKDGVSGVVFRAGDPRALADGIERLRNDRALYARLSRNAEDAARDFFVPLKYDGLISAFLSGTAEANAQLAPLSIGSGRYDGAAATAAPH
jgi:glycosyltransferase involved in cell wall biosynthesis